MGGTGADCGAGQYLSRTPTGASATQGGCPVPVEYVSGSDVASGSSAASGGRSTKPPPVNRAKFSRAQDIVGRKQEPCYIGDDTVPNGVPTMARPGMPPIARGLAKVGRKGRYQPSRSDTTVKAPSVTLLIIDSARRYPGLPIGSAAEEPMVRRLTAGGGSLERTSLWNRAGKLGPNFKTFMDHLGSVRAPFRARIGREF